MQVESGQTAPARPDEQSMNASSDVVSGRGEDSVEDDEEEEEKGEEVDEPPAVEVVSVPREVVWNPAVPLVGGEAGSSAAASMGLPEQLLAMGDIMPDEEAMMNLAIALSLVSARWKFG